VIQLDDKGNAYYADEHYGIEVELEVIKKKISYITVTDQSTGLRADANQAYNPVSFEYGASALQAQAQNWRTDQLLGVRCRLKVTANKR
jgi:hypothetical protein